MRRGGVSEMCTAIRRCGALRGGGVSEMCTAALALAVALLIVPGPVAVRRVKRDAQSRSVSPAALAVNDPLAAASTLDALAVCLTAGLSVPVAARAVAGSASPELAAVLRRGADLLSLGADPATAWSPRPGDGVDGASEALLRLARRSAVSGAALAGGVAELAAQSRQELGHRAQAAAERAAVVIAGPLGLCFLPAFLCLGVVPVVAGLATEVLGSGLW